MASVIDLQRESETCIPCHTLGSRGNLSHGQDHTRFRRLILTSRWNLEKEDLDMIPFAVIIPLADTAGSPIPGNRQSPQRWRPGINVGGKGRISLPATTAGP
mmetsp:Transcript_9869/g.20069  ORF Transcript_9869/g.20069 Transcript_9869/m.20069 type:complete len:102 (+) Transcript_9869:1149-1454(+)